MMRVSPLAYKGTAPDFLPAAKQRSNSIDEIIISSLCLLGTVCWD